VSTPETQSTEPIRSDLERALGRRVEAVRPIPEGHSGFTYFVDLEGGQRGVLRLPPPGARIAGPADIPRQGRIMGSLHDAGLPTPGVIAMSTDAVVDGRPYVLVEAIDGERIERVMGRVKPLDIAASAVEVLRRIHALPLEKTGIGDEPAQPLAAERARWTWLVERSPEELMQRAPKLAALLGERMPEERPPTLVHGDYHYGNMLFRDAHVVAVLDWEIAQVGQPLLDLACQCVVAQAARSGDPKIAVPGGGVVDVPDEMLLQLYGGVGVEEFNWYLALTYYKYASIFGYNLMLHRRGKRPDPIYEERTTTIVAFIEEGIRLLGGT
jgi:aminoglycoside phosphotransferase (APT) family kinase protein